MASAVLPRLVLGAAAVLFAAFGLLPAVAPHQTARMVDIELPTSTATIDFIATYGGFQIGFAIFLFTCLMRPERVRLGLLASGWAVAGFGVLTRGGTSGARRRHADQCTGALAFEAVCATLAFVAASRAASAHRGP